MEKLILIVLMSCAAMLVGASPFCAVAGKNDSASAYQNDQPYLNVTVENTGGGKRYPLYVLKNKVAKGVKWENPKTFAPSKGAASLLFKRSDSLIYSQSFSGDVLATLELQYNLDHQDQKGTCVITIPNPNKCDSTPIVKCADNSTVNFDFIYKSGSDDLTLQIRKN